MSGSRFFPGWKVVIGSGIGIGSGSIVFFPSCYALLSAEMAKDYGWVQADVAKGASIFLIVQTFAYPLCGVVLDRWGSRAFATFSIAIFAVSMAALSLVSGELWQLYAALAFMALLSAGTNVVSYARAIAQWFNRKRGLAIGLAAAAQAIGLFIMPLVFHGLAAKWGWSRALWPIAAFELVVALPLVALLVKDSPAPYGLLPDGEAPTGKTAVGATEERDPTLGEMVRTAVFWKLSICFAVMGMTIYAIIPNIVYILTKRLGMSLGDVATIQALSGLATLCGRIGFGFLLDRFHAPAVALIALAMSAFCATVYSTSDVAAVIVFAAIVNGVANGGDTDLMPFLAARYFGARAVSRIFGWFLFAFFLGASIGPVAFAKLTAIYGGPATPLLMLAGLQILPAILFVSLWRYSRASAAALNPA
ncbi:MAG: MFS transporter [Hyphomicrobiales bacterium]|nr:MFS transporter [Hyphomicrobiales bacterium]